jgi:hypothetical protein
MLHFTVTITHAIAQTATQWVLPTVRKMLRKKWHWTLSTMVFTCQLPLCQRSILMSPGADITGPSEAAVPWNGLTSLLQLTTVMIRTAFQILYYIPL